MLQSISSPSPVQSQSSPCFSNSHGELPTMGSVRRRHQHSGGHKFSPSLLRLCNDYHHQHHHHPYIMCLSCASVHTSRDFYSSHWSPVFPPTWLRLGAHRRSKIPWTPLHSVVPTTPSWTHCISPQGYCHQMP